MALLLTGTIAAVTAFKKTEDDPITKIAAQLDKWLSANPQEKVYLQTDKPYYAVGDDIWFKAYITTGANHQLSAISGVLNVELIDDRDSVKQYIKLPVTSGVAWGDFSLPDTLKAGNYRLRAYTNWMRNAGSNYFFDKVITLSNAVSNQVFTNTSYSYSNQNGRQQVNATIRYADLGGVPYSGKAVSYRVLLNNAVADRGKGVTDTAGNLSISFAVAKQDSSGSGRIITDIKLSDKKSVEKSILVKAVSADVKVQFFPEGGNLIYGNDSKIAFKAVGADGLGVSIKGVVTDGNNKQAGMFISNQLGMGTFSLNPENGRVYKAKITYADGSVNTVDLPKATNTGYALNIDDINASYIRVRISPGAVTAAAASPGDMLNLVGQAGGQVLYAGKSKPGSMSLTALIPKSKFRDGIVQFTLFSAAGEPMNERLIFIQNHNQLKLTAKTDQPDYAPRQKVKIDLSAASKDGKPAIGSFSVAVTDESKVPVDEGGENTILSYLLLTSELKGYVEKPGYYFISDDEKTKADLDALMLTQGYRRFEWKQVLSNTWPAPAFKVEKSLEISGHLKNLLGKPVAHGIITLFASGSNIFLLTDTTDNEGRFSFKNLVFKDSVRFLVQGRTAKDRKNLQIDIDNITPQPVMPSVNFPEFAVNESGAMAPYLRNSKALYDSQVKYGIRNGAIMLNEVVIKEKKTEPLKNSSNLNGAGNADQVIRADDPIFSGCANIADCLQGRIPGVVFRNDTPFLVRSIHQPMQIELDGLYIDGSVLANLNPNDIASIEVLRSIAYTSIYGGRGSGGVLVITTKTGSPGEAYKVYAPGVVTLMPKGYNKVREFYSPQYDNPKTNADIPDLRSTIYWKPNIVTREDGKASLEYFNADGKGTYRVVIEGIDANGNLGRQVLRYMVK